MTSYVKGLIPLLGLGLVGVADAKGKGGHGLKGGKAKVAGKAKARKATP